MRRREFIGVLGGASAWPVVAQGQQTKMPVIGYLSAGSPEPTANLLSAFHKGLSESGYVVNQNVVIEYRWAHTDHQRLAELAADLVRRGVAVIAVSASTPAALAAKAATATIPIVFASGVDPVEAGLVDSINRPGHNVTGVSYMQSELGEKRLDLLRELLPKAARFAVLINPANPSETTKRALASAMARGWQVEILAVSTNRDIDAAFSRIVQNPPDAVLISADPLFFARRVQIVTWAVRHAMPTIFANREYPEIGGLMSYGPKLTDQIRQLGVYAGRILKGEKPADLPVVLPTTFEFVINLQTAKIFGLTVPPTRLARADEVIE
jgi:putative ABC transport system substrate-binding protein